MEDVIQCPTCNKKYRLPASPPATFTCRNCETVMDLSGFAAPDEQVPAAPVAPPPPQPAPGAGGVPMPRRHGRGGHRHPRAGRAARGRRGREPAGGYEDEGHDEGPRYRSYGNRGPNMGLVLGSLALVIVAVIVMVVWLGSRDKGDQGKETAKKAPVVQPVVPVVQPPKEEPKEVPKEAPKEEPKDVEDARPELREGSLERVPIPEGKSKYRVGQAKLKTYPWPEHVTAEERNQIDAWIEAAVEYGGRDGMEGEAGLAAMDKDTPAGTAFKAVGRLISQFKTVKDQYGADNPDGLSRLMVIDRILRQVDGVMERDFKDLSGIRMQTPEPEAMLIMKRWHWWYDLEKWREIRREPWDPALDMLDEEEEE